MDDAGKKKLLEEYAKTKSPETRETIILEYAPLVKVVAGRLSMYLGYNVEYEDLVSYGIFGLIDAIDKFDCLKDVKFETYASLRIRGAILDQIRKMDWIPRTIRQKQKKIEAVIKEIEQSEGRAPTDEEVARGLGISDEEYLDWQSQMKITGLVSLDEYMQLLLLLVPCYLFSYYFFHRSAGGAGGAGRADEGVGRGIIASDRERTEGNHSLLL